MRTLIFLGGEKPSSSLSRDAAGRADFIIAADSGYIPALENGIRPDIVTGDFDSIGEPPPSDDCKVIPAPEQDATDFQKALRHIPDGCQAVEILGGTGLRSDHFLTNLLIAAGLRLNRSVIFQDDTQSIIRVTPECPMNSPISIECVISIVPFSTCSGVTTTGLHWNLQDCRMGPTHQLGQSNRVDHSPVRIHLKEGILYVVVNH